MSYDRSEPVNPEDVDSGTPLGQDEPDATVAPSEPPLEQINSQIGQGEPDGITNPPEQSAGLPTLAGRDYITYSFEYGYDQWRRGELLSIDASPA